MKIQDISPYANTGSLARRPTPSEGKSFDKIFNQTLEDAAGAGETPAGPAPSGPGNLSPLFNSPVAEPALVRQASEVLDHLEAYSDALKDSRVTLKGLEPLVARLEKDAEALGQAVGHGGDEEDKASGVANEIAVTARMEAIKFRRGDYIA